MKRSEEKALGLYLTAWPENSTFEVILDRLNNDELEGEDEDDDISVWEPFENDDVSYVVENIKSAQEGLTDLDKYEAIEALVKGVYDNQALTSIGFLSVDPYQTVKRIVGV